MSANSAIEWTDHTFNPWIGCTKVSPACDRCYAERSIPARFRGIAWGPHEPRVRTSDANWELPKRWNAQHGAFFNQHGRRQRVFCASLADVFDNAVDPAWRADLFDVIRATPNLDWLLLTKRIGNVFGMLPMDFNAERYPNVWLGATIADQPEADRDITKLLAINARVHFLSMEPLLGLVSFGGLFANPGNPADGTNALEALDWVIVGGESGPGARPMHPDWARSLRDQCQVAGVPFFFKQWGDWVEPDIDGMAVRLTAREGDPEFCEAASKVDGFLSVDGDFALNVDDIEPDVRYLGMKRIGKKAAGRLLDSRTWDEFPR